MRVDAAPPKEAVQRPAGPSPAAKARFRDLLGQREPRLAPARTDDGGAGPSGRPLAAPAPAVARPGAVAVAHAFGFAELGMFGIAASPPRAAGSAANAPAALPGGGAADAASDGGAAPEAARVIWAAAAVARVATAAAAAEGRPQTITAARAPDALASAVTAPAAEIATAEDFPDAGPVSGRPAPTGGGAARAPRAPAVRLSVRETDAGLEIVAGGRFPRADLVAVGRALVDVAAQLGRRIIALQINGASTLGAAQRQRGSNGHRAG